MVHTLNQLSLYCRVLSAYENNERCDWAFKSVSSICLSLGKGGQGIAHCGSETPLLRTDPHIDSLLYSHVGVCYVLCTSHTTFSKIVLQIGLSLPTTLSFFILTFICAFSTFCSTICLREWEWEEVNRMRGDEGRKGKRWKKKGVKMKKEDSEWIEVPSD